MLLGPVAAEAVSRHLKLLCAVAKAHEAEDPQQDSDSLRRHHLDGAHVDGLGVVTQPVAKVDALDVHFAELLARLAADEQREQRVLDVTVTPVLAFNGAQAGDVACSERRRGAGPEYKQHQAGQPHVAEELRRHRGLMCEFRSVSEGREYRGKCRDGICG